MPRFLGTLLIVTVACLPVQATFVTTDVNVFNGMVGSTYNPNPNTFTGATSGVFSNNGYSYTITAAPSGSGIQVAAASNPTGAFIYAAQDSDSLTITLTSGNVKAIGGDFFPVSGGEAFESFPVTVTLNDGTTKTITPVNIAGGFIGFTSNTPITSLTITGQAGGSGLHDAVDNLTVGGLTTGGLGTGATPAPATALIAFAGMPLLGVLRRYRKN